MEHGLDVSLKLTAICVVDQTGSVMREGVVDSDPETIAEFVTSNAPSVVRIGLETGPTATWLWTELGSLCTAPQSRTGASGLTECARQMARIPGRPEWHETSLRRSPVSE